jgi:hypothetical protein
MGQWAMGDRDTVNTHLAAAVRAFEAHGHPGPFTLEAGPQVLAALREMGVVDGDDRVNLAGVGEVVVRDASRREPARTGSLRYSPSLTKGKR